MDSAERSALQKAARKVAAAIPKQQPQATFAQGTVASVDADGTAWVSVGDELVPCAPEAGCREGDEVTVRVEPSGRAFASGNVSVPAVNANDVEQAEERIYGRVESVRSQVSQEASRAAGIAEEAAAVASATGQHFWDADDGAHVTEETKDEWLDAAANDFADLDESHNHWNTLWNSMGMLFRRALNDLVSITHSAIAFYSGDGNTADDFVAGFGKDGIIFGNGIDFTIGGGDSYIRYYDSNEDGKADSIDISGANVTIGGDAAATQSWTGSLADKLSSRIETNAEDIASEITSRAETDAAVAAVSEQATQTESDLADAVAQIGELSGTVEDSASDISELKARVYEETPRYVRFGSDGVSLGDEAWTAGIDIVDEGIMLVDRSDGTERVPAYVSGGMLNIQAATVVGDLWFGHWKWVERENGHMTLVREA